MESEVASAVAQFGVAGLIGWMWLTERRAAQARERQLTEVHERLVQERATLDVVMRVVTANTRALAALEGTQNRLTRLLDAIASRAGAPGS